MRNEKGEIVEHVLYKEEGGLRKWTRGEEDEDEARVKPLVQLFQAVNMSGDGYMAYHEFLLRFTIRPKPLEQSHSFDKQLRAALLDKFNNITDAFVGLDIDFDNRLNREDFIKGFEKHQILVSSPRHTRGSSPHSHLKTSCLERLGAQPPRCNAHALAS